MFGLRSRGGSFQDRCGITEATYPGQLPWNEQQISNFEHRIPQSTGQKLSGQLESDELYSIMLQAHMESDGEKYMYECIQDFKAHPEPAIVFYQSPFCVLTVDPTFSLGDFDVTPTTYRHLLLVSKLTGKPPVAVGHSLQEYDCSEQKPLIDAF